MCDSKWCGETPSLEECKLIVRKMQRVGFAGQMGLDHGLGMTLREGLGLCHVGSDLSQLWKQGTMWSHVCFWLFTCSESLQSLTNLTYFTQSFEISEAGDAISSWETPTETCQVEGVHSWRYIGRDRVMKRVVWMENKSTLAGVWCIQDNWKRGSLVR